MIKKSTTGETPATKKKVAVKKTVGQVEEPKQTAMAKKAVSKKAVAKKTAAKKKTPAKKAAVSKKAAATASTESKKAASHTLISPRERYQMIATMAYYRAEKRNFAPGNDEQDWLECEQIIDEMLNKK